MPKFLKFSYLMQVQMPCIKKIRKSQLRITYTLYHLGLNEIRTLEIQDILQGIERQELKLHYSKQTDPIMLHFHPVL
jgi:hypothetical protein